MAGIITIACVGSASLMDQIPSARPLTLTRKPQTPNPKPLKKKNLNAKPEALNREALDTSCHGPKPCSWAGFGSSFSARRTAREKA